MDKIQRTIARKFFANFPVCHAIVRTNEALALSQVKLPRPILDLGCGDGQFALFTFGGKQIEVGLDKDQQITPAKKAAYIKTLVGQGEEMPFKDRSFSSVVANSVLEHVDHLDRVLVEVARVLKRGGFFLFTVPTPLVSSYQFWSKFIPKYSQLKRKIWRHRNYFGQEQWRKRLTKAGFKVMAINKTNSQSAIAWADIFTPLVLFGSIKSAFPFLEKRKVFGLDDQGATLIFLAKKP